MNNDFSEQYAQFRRKMTAMNRAIPETAAGFRTLHAATMTGEGALDRKTKELIAVAIGIAVRCDGCIVSHVRSALRAGATRAELLDVIGVAIFMGGGPSTVYGAEALEALDQFEQTQAPAPVTP